MNSLDVLTKIAIDFAIFTFEFLAFTFYRKFRSQPIPLEDENIKIPAFSESETPLYALMKVVWSVPYSEIHNYCGLEGKLYLAFHQTIAKGFLLMAVISCVILIPIYAADEETHDDYNNLGMQHIIKQEDKMSSVLIFFLVFTVLGVLMTIAYIKLLSQAYCAESNLDCAIDRYTVQIQGLPMEETHLLQGKVFAFLEEHFPDHVQALYLVPNLYRAYRAKLAMQEAQRQICRYREYSETHSRPKKIRTSRYGPKVDAVQHFQVELAKQQERYHTEFQNGKGTCSGTAFVLCNTSACAYSLISKFKGYKSILNSDKWKLSIAPPPAEINWQNMKNSEPRTRCLRVLIYLLYVFVFFVLLTPLTMLVLVTLLLESIELKNNLELVSDAFLPSIVLLLYLSVILRHSVLRLVFKEKLTSKSEETVSAMKKYVLVMVTYTFLVPLLGIQSLTMMWVWVDSPDSQIDFGSDPADSGLYFFFLVTHLAFLKNAGDFIQLPKYFRVKIRQIKALNPREKLLAYEHYEFRWAYEYGISICFYFIVMAFAIIYPLMLVVGSFFFFMRYFTAKYNLLCFYHPVKTTTGTRVTRALTASLMIGILIFQILTCVIIALHSTTTYIGISISLLIISACIFFLVYSNRFTLETALKKKFQNEPNDDKQFVSIHNMSNYYHPMEKEIQEANIPNNNIQY